MFLGCAMSYRDFCLIIVSFLFIASPARAASEADLSCPDVSGVVAVESITDIPTLEKMAGNDNLSAAISVARLYTEQKKFADAEKWYRYALYKEDGRGALGLFELYQMKGIALDDPDRIKQYGLNLIKEDALKGNGGSAITLATLYLQGQYVGTDYNKAREWFLVAEKAGKPAASYQLGLLSINGLMDSIQPRVAFHYFEKASAAGIAAATRQVAIAFYTGIGTIKNKEAALTCFQRSAAQGDVLAMRDVGNIYLVDKKDKGAADSWFRKAAALGDPDSHYRIGNYAAAAKMKHHLSRVIADPGYVPKHE